MTTQKEETKDKTVAVRFPVSEADLVREIAVNRGEDVSSFIRRSVKHEFKRLGFLPEQEAKALGV